VVGFAEELAARGVPLQPELNLVVEDENDVRSGVAKLLSLSNPPTAIFAYQDSLAATVYRQVQQLGLSIPDDITVVGFDNLDLATYLSPRLTTVGTHITPLCSAFVSLLVRRIQGIDPELPPQTIVVTPKIIVRESSNSPRSHSQLRSKSRAI
jgi:LacI family transcriptional regulator